MNAVTKFQPRLPMPQVDGIGPDQWRVLTEAIFPSAKSADSIALAISYCRARNLDVFKRPVHIVPMWNSTLRREVETVWPGISELQVTAARTKAWAGMDEPVWGPMTTKTFKGRVKRGDEWVDATETVTFPEWCSVRVWRIVGNERCGFAEPVFWEEAYSRQGKSDLPNAMWLKRVRGQLHKVAKAASLRAAFPEEVSDYAAEEMEGKETTGGGVVIDGHVEDVAPASRAATLPKADAAADMHSEMLSRTARAKEPAMAAASSGGRPDPLTSLRNGHVIDAEAEPSDDPAPDAWPWDGEPDAWASAWAGRIQKAPDVEKLDQAMANVSEKLRWLAENMPDMSAEVMGAIDVRRRHLQGHR